MCGKAHFKGLGQVGSAIRGLSGKLHHKARRAKSAVKTTPRPEDNVGGLGSEEDTKAHINVERRVAKGASFSEAPAIVITIPDDASIKTTKAPKEDTSSNFLKPSAALRRRKSHDLDDVLVLQFPLQAIVF